MIKLYGPHDEDASLLEAVTNLIGDTDATIAMFKRQPRNVKACQYPGRLRFEIVIAGKAYAAFQDIEGRIELPNI